MYLEHYDTKTWISKNAPICRFSQIKSHMKIEFENYCSDHMTNKNEFHVTMEAGHVEKQTAQKLIAYTIKCAG